MSLNSLTSPLADYAGPPPVLVVAGSSIAHRRAATTIEAAGFRVAPVSLADAVDRMALQASASALWVELDEDSPELDRLLDRIDAEASMDRFSAIVAAPLALIDPVVARLTDSRTTLLIDAGLADRMAALAVATAGRGEGARLHDVASEHNAARLRQLSDEVGRIAATLARLSIGPAMPGAEKPPTAAVGGDFPSVSGEVIRQVIRARRLRARFFDEELFADPAWDMLLDLLAAEIAQHRVPVSSLCIAAAVPATTALRWIKTMTDNGMFLRRSDPHDGRRVFVELSPGASEGMRRYFGEVGKVAAI
ncbi:MAG: MarR family transcriptional regulator [Sphingomonas sp.]|uniref:MarR family transcriptional regulator n=1 Tax=Sphingomonas sp. TaxID=28214 RepID=UPI0018159764|nr:MarR family transcriptional regulator [Sphingomonas sp.]MBA3667317.1 MarR family transcriptional regulator [Sphingomonas sp.]